MSINNYRKKRRPFFTGKTCSICKLPASMFRVIKGKHIMLCNSKKCEKITRIRAGYFDLAFNKIKLIKNKENKHVRR